ncbi:hypothetical protein GYMLUDRAFT_52648 [Collybiopsis luxurians FD-317 M1]|nr:hypothetical protein GYMLUDRAFT_52648 [Collybiopsis luxurians FD-317 M1]
MFSTFCDVPPEIWNIIGDYLLADVPALKCLASTCRQALVIVNPILYSTITIPESLTTLATSTTFRALDIPHAASFVKSLHLDFQVFGNSGISGWKNLHLLNGTFQQAVINLIEHGKFGQDARTPALKSLVLKCPLTITALFENVVLRQFCLQNVWIRCLPPKNTEEDLQRCSEIVVRVFFYRNALRRLVFDFDDRSTGMSRMFTVALASAHTCTILMQICHYAFNLRELHVCCPRPLSEEQDADVATAFSKMLENLCFPNLFAVTICFNWGLSDAVIDLVPFLHRHSNLSYLACSMLEGRPLLNSDFDFTDLPNLRDCVAVAEDALLLCRQTNAEKLTDIHIEFSCRSNISLEEQICCCLENIGKSLRVLGLDCHMYIQQNGLSAWENICFSMSSYNRIFNACKDITMLECMVDPTLLLDGFANLLSTQLRSLQSLIITVVDNRAETTVEEVQKVVLDMWLVLTKDSTLPSTFQVQYYYHLQPGVEGWINATLEGKHLIFTFPKADEM